MTARLILLNKTIFTRKYHDVGLVTSVWNAYHFAKKNRKITRTGLNSVPPPHQKFMFTQSLRMWSYLEIGTMQICNFSKYLRWGHTGLWRTLDPMTGVLITGGEDTEKATRRWRQRLEWCSYRPRTVRGAGEWPPMAGGRGKEGFSPKLWREDGPARTLTLHF